MSPGRPCRPCRAPLDTFVRIDGVPHHVVVEGAGPVCVLSAGLGMAWYDWDAVTALLAPYRTVVRFDRPGLGLSGPARAAPTLAAEADRILHVLDACGLPGPATLVGHSLAGLHCEAAARRHPDRVARLVLVDSSVEERARPRPSPGLRVGAARLCGALLGAAGLPYVLGPALRRASVFLARTGGGDPAPYELVRRTYGTSRSLRAMVAEHATYLDVAAQLAVLRRQSGLSAGLPVTVLTAGADRRWLRRQRRLAALLAADHRISPESGHLLMLDHPHDVAAAVRGA
ncbi:alpha/beta fold hydrolase [Streptomyces cavernicola]|uniref:Alpha/beta hydrolase n=1 Tax=Streptomyces cavernicola TaxID=3043613 RepID=A0ABT6SDR9_9ACTN|nr:alpha/beta hydrolase [Streptomyces sp. B-S-A6]MDI3405979.1 alpha/beta hydrolase [Streptomyces sp. B-S-A6]